MAEMYIKSYDLHPEEALGILAQIESPLYLSYLKRIRVAVNTQSSFVFLFAPQSPSKDRGEKEKHVTFIQIFQKLHNAISGQPPQMNATLPNNTMPLQAGIIQLLAQTHKDKWQDDLNVVANERLLVGKNQPDIAELSEKLRIHATKTKINISITSDETYTIFYIMDDQSRGSTFSGLVAAGLFIGWHLLQAVTCEEYRLFLPTDIWPKPEVLANFCRLLRNSPQLFSPTLPRPDNKTLGGIIRQPDGGEMTLIFLGNLLFTDLDELSPSVAGYTRFTVCNLTDSAEKMKQLYDEIQSLEQRVGYRLELRATGVKEEIVVEQGRLLEEWHKLNYEIKLLEAYNLARPILLRFTSAQLAAFGDYLSRLPGKILRDGNLLYGFQATDRNPTGFHFLYVDPIAVKEPDMDPLIRWLRLDFGRPMRFWLDPFWAKHYYNNKNRSKLFVPEYTTLFPTAHDWNVETGQMDVYLQKIIKRWLQDQGNNHFHHNLYPHSPVYVFDGEVDVWGELDIYILDLDDFQPLYTKLGWLNDHLSLRQVWDIELTVASVAADAIWQKTAEQISQRRNETAQAFDSDALQVSQAMAEKTAVLMSALTNKLELLQKAAGKQRERIGELQVQLDRLNALYSQVAGTVGQAQDTENAIHEQMKDFHREEKTIRDEVAEFQQKAQEATENVGQQIDELVAELKRAYQREEEKLYNLNRRRR